MPQLAGTSNEDSLNLAANLTVGGTMGVTGATAFGSSVKFNGPVTNATGGVMPGTAYVAAGTVTLNSGFVEFNVSAAGFAVQLPAPVKGAEFRIVNQIAPSGGTNTITIPAGGTIYQGTASGSVLGFATLGQTATLLGLSATQYRVISNMGSPILS